MNKNEPIIINKAGAGYLVKPLSYMFHDEGEETFEVFSDMVTLSIWMINHFETAPDVARTKSTPVMSEVKEIDVIKTHIAKQKELPTGISAIHKMSEKRTHTGTISKAVIEEAKGGPNVRTSSKPRTTPKTKK